MNLGVASNTNAEKVPVSLSNESHEVHCIVESVFVVNPVSCASGRVSPECQNVSDAELLRLVKTIDDLLARHISAGHMHQNVEATVLLNVTAEVKSDV